MPDSRSNNKQVNLKVRTEYKTLQKSSREECYHVKSDHVKCFGRVKTRRHQLTAMRSEADLIDVELALLHRLDERPMCTRTKALTQA